MDYAYSIGSSAGVCVRSIMPNLQVSFVAARSVARSAQARFLFFAWLALQHSKNPDYTIMMMRNTDKNLQITCYYCAFEFTDSVRQATPRQNGTREQGSQVKVKI